MITELIFSAAALVFYFGIEMYYQYKDKVSDEDPVTVTTYTEPKKELTFADIEEGDTVTLFIYNSSGRLHISTAEGVVTHKGVGLIKIGRTWYDENKSDYELYKVAHIRKPEKEIRLVKVLPEMGTQGLAGPQGRVWISDTGPK